MVIATENTHDTVMNNGITPDNMKTKLKDKAKIDNIKMFVYQYVVFHKDQSKIHIFTRTKPLMVIATENTHDTAMNGITPDNMETNLKDRTKIDDSVINVCVSVCGVPQGSIQGPHFH